MTSELRPPRSPWRRRRTPYAVVGVAAASVLVAVTASGLGRGEEDRGSDDEPRGVARGTQAAATVTRQEPVALRVSGQVSDQVPVRASVKMAGSVASGAGTLTIVSGSNELARTPLSEGAHRRVHVEIPALHVGDHQLSAVFHSSSGEATHSEPVAVTSNSGCAWRPRACGYPDAATTGPRPGARLVSVPEDRKKGKGWHFDPRGWIEIDRDGTVLSGIRSSYHIEVYADDVVVRDVALNVPGETWGIGLRSTSNVTIKRVSITAPSATSADRLLVGIKDMDSDSRGLVVRDSDISRTSTGIQVESGLLRDNYIHDLGLTGGDHVNGTTSNGGSDLLVIRHNTVFNQWDQTDAISLFQDFGPQANRRIVDNLVAGGGYTIYAGANPGKEHGASNIHVIGNRFARIYHSRAGQYGPATAYAHGNGNLWQDNVWDESGRPVLP